MQNVRLVAAAALTAFFSTAASAVAADRTYDFDDFTRVDVSTGLTAIITEADDYAIRVDAETDDLLDDIEITLSGDTLTARFDRSFLDFVFDGGLLGMIFEDERQATVHISAPPLERVSASSGAQIRLDQASAEDFAADASSGAGIQVGQTSAESVQISVSSGAQISINGECSTAQLNFSSGGGIDADSLDCTDINANGSSGAQASIIANGEVRGAVSSGAQLRLSGDPDSINVTSSSGGGVQLN